MLFAEPKAWRLLKFLNVDFFVVMTSPGLPCLLMDESGRHQFGEAAYRHQIIGTLEIKSGISTTGSINAMEFESFEPYTCVFGSSEYFKLTAKEHHAQLLMQAYVMDVRKVVYARATETELHTLVLILFPDEAILNAELALNACESAIKWLHNDKLKFPLWMSQGYENEKAIIKSHWPFWNSL